jgi:hypothetical protein
MNPHHAAIPDPAQQAELNRELHATGTDTGFWNDHGRPAPWPDDIDEWKPAATGQSISLKPGEEPF